MKRLVLLAAVLLCGCAKDPVAVTSTNNNGVQVDTLFTKDSCTVYRFSDAGEFIYYVVCTKPEYSAMVDSEYMAGKTTHVRHVPTVTK